MARKEKSPFEKSRAIESEYARNLRAIASEVGRIVSGYNPLDPLQLIAMNEALKQYAKILEPWARSKANTMVARMNAQDEKIWRKVSGQISAELRDEIARAPTGIEMRRLVNEQVDLITSLPTRAGLRAQKLAQQVAVTGARSKNIVEEIQRTGKVTKARATMIARTETSKASTALTEARAEHIGSEGYIWRTAGDGDVRPSHKSMNGKFVRWDEKPTLDGMTGHAGEFPNCFTGETTVSLIGDLQGIFRSPYKGSIIEISTRNSFFSATPNHPILTQRGWIPAKEITKSDYLVKSIDNAANIIKDNTDNMKASLEELFITFNVNGKTSNGFKFNFYGDIPDGEVDAISINEFLSSNFMPQFFHSVRDFLLSDSNRMIVAFVVCGGGHIVKPLFSGVGNEIPSLLMREIAHSNIISLTGSSPLYPMIFQPSANSESGNTMLLSEGEFTNPSFIIRNDFMFRKVINSIVSPTDRLGDRKSYFLESITKSIGSYPNIDSGIFKKRSFANHLLGIKDINVRYFSGHVYTLQSSNGWYNVAHDNIIVKNCRCYPEPVIPENLK